MELEMGLGKWNWRCPDNGQEWQTIEPNMAATWQPNKKQLDSESRAAPSRWLYK